jgi:hypothetical protein
MPLGKILQPLANDLMRHDLSGPDRRPRLPDDGRQQGVLLRIAQSPPLRLPHATSIGPFASSPSALEATKAGRCIRVYSEDMQAGRRFGIEVVNPFA